MTYLLDTHTFLWFINDDRALSNTAKTLIENPESVIYLSVASLWEMAIKVSLGKLAVPFPFGDFIDTQLRMNSVFRLGIKVEHVDHVTNMPFHHRDPFDRLIIAQSQHEDYPVIGRDENFDVYHIKRHW